jgi:hypothetical protein
MRNELENIELIEKYLRDELSAVDKKAFEEQLKTDANLQKEVDLQKETVKGIERLGAKASVQKASRTYDNRRRGFFLGLFLAVIVSGVVGINYISNNTESIEIISEDIVEIVSEDFVEIVGEDTVEIPIDIAKDELEETEVLVAAIEKREFNSEIVSFPKKKFQYFSINSSKDELIVGAEGTIIEFKANSFNVPKNSSLKIRLKEYYKMSDIAFSNLTTETDDGKLLETGGMIYIDALVNNKKVYLKKNTFFDIKFPFDKKKEDMILFDGKTKNKNVVWEELQVRKIEVVEKFEEDDFLAKAKVESNKLRTESVRQVDIIKKKGGNFLEKKANEVIAKEIMRQGNKQADSIITWAQQETKSEIEDILFENDNSVKKKNKREQDIAISEINSYILSGSKLGWINCDRFARRGNLNLAIKLDDKNTDVKIIFHRIKSLIAGYNNGLYSKFGRIPTGERVTVFAVKYVDKKPYICLKEFMTSSKSIKLEFDELTKEGLKDVTKRISKI